MVLTTPPVLIALLSLSAGYQAFHEKSKKFSLKILTVNFVNGKRLDPDMSIEFLQGLRNPIPESKPG